jgi:D-lactate dehydrogenase
MGVIGTGKIGMHVCRIASLGFLMDVIAYDPYPNKDKAADYHFKYVRSLEDIWKKSDVITLHVPLFPETKHMINAKTIAKMKDGVVLINTARGGLIDTKALVKAIKKGKFADVALDVLEHEEQIKKNEEIMNLPGVIITPHVAFYADDSVDKMYSEAIDSIKRFCKGEKLIHQVHGH